MIEKREMIILHISEIQTNLDNGVNAVVPKHVLEQGKYAHTALLNVNNVSINGVDQLEYDSKGDFPQYLPQPFDKPDLVVFHEVNRIEYIRLYKALLKKGIPYIIVPHGEITKTALRKKWLKKKIAYLLWFNGFIKNAKAIQCLSEGEESRISITKKLFVGSNGLYVPDKQKFSFSETGMKLVYIGRIEMKIKGLDLLVKAMADIAEFARKNGVVLNIYGPDYKGRRKQLEDLIKHFNVGDLIFVNEAIFGEEKEKVLLSNDVFIQTSRSEGLPLGVLESMSYGMPQILTKGTSMLDSLICCDGGYSAGSTVTEIKAAILNAYKDRENWAEKGSRSRSFVISNLCWGKIAQETVEKYRTLLD